MSVREKERERERERERRSAREMTGSSNGAATNGGAANGNGAQNGNGTSFALHPHASITKGEGPLLVCILDGWGENTVCDEYNAVFVAETPTMDAIKEKGMRTELWSCVHVLLHFSLSLSLLCVCVCVFAYVHVCKRMRGKKSM